jgi:hypothetical protein
MYDSVSHLVAGILVVPLNDLTVIMVLFVSKSVSQVRMKCTSLYGHYNRCGNL